MVSDRKMKNNLKKETPQMKYIKFHLKYKTD